MPGFGYPFAIVNEAPAPSGQPRGRDLALDPTTGDLLVAGSDLSMVKDLDAIRQEVSIKLQFLLGEWFLDKTKGVPYLQKVLVKVPNMAAIRTVLRNAILDCVGILSITKLDVTFDSKTRRLVCVWSAITDLGPLNDQEVTI